MNKKIPEREAKTKGTFKYIGTDKKVTFKIKKEISLRASEYDKKEFVLQKIEFTNPITNKKQNLLRLGYYIIGEKLSRKGKWVWGQFCPFMVGEDLKKIIKMAQKEGIL